MDCLVIVDVQKGFLTKDTFYIPERIKSLLKIKNFDYIVATRFINTKKSPHYMLMHWDKIMDQESQQLEEYVMSVSQKVFDKNVNSCFSRSFVRFLKEKSISKLFFVGIDTDCCVLKSAFDCFDRNIPFEVISDCCSSTGGLSFHLNACEIMKRNFGDEKVREYGLS